jgi:Uma2 family endonuclease
MSTTFDTDLVIGPELAGSLMSADEFDTAEEWDENYNYELINGVLVVVPPASEGERGPNDLLAFWLRKYCDEHPQGKSLDYTLTEHTIATSRGNRRRADRVIWAGLGRMPNVRRETPTSAIEFVSPGRAAWKRDYEVKRDEYLETGIVEYWVINRFERTLTVFEKTSAGPRQTVVHEGETFATSLLPGFQLPLAQLLAEADRLEQALGEAE